MNPAIRKVLRGQVNTCQDCGTTFRPRQLRTANQKRCPTCQDKVQQRPQIVTWRRLVALHLNVQIESLPGEWKQFQASETDDPCWKIDISGRSLDTTDEGWEGRIVIYSPFQFQPGHVVNVRHMEVTKQVRARKGTKEINGRQFTNRYDVNAEVTDSEIITEKQQYFALETSPSSVPSAVLRWIDECYDGEVLSKISAYDGHSKYLILTSTVNTEQYLGLSTTLTRLISATVSEEE